MLHQLELFGRSPLCQAEASRIMCIRARKPLNPTVLRILQYKSKEKQSFLHTYRKVKHNPPVILMHGGGDGGLQHEVSPR